MLKKFWAKKSNRYLLLFIGLFIVATFFVGQTAAASWLGDAVAQLLCWIVYGIIWILGKILMLIMWVLITIVQYNNFIHAAPITYGWVIVRDICNMFFILILLIIAFGTILRLPQYSFKQLLPKLVIMAVLINFSKLICGILIDFAQVVMLTFVNGFKEVGEGNLFQMLGIEDILSIKDSSSSDGTVTGWSILGAYILALIFVVIALVTLITMVSMLAMRIVMMWIYVVLSPLAYLLAAFPAGQQYSSQWWSRFSKNLIVGPVLAFFIWLAFASLGGTTSSDVNDIVQSNSKLKTTDVVDTTGVNTTLPSAGITKAGSADHMIKFIISIAMLIGGLQIAQEIGGEAGSMAGKGIQRLQSMKAGTMKGFAKAGKFMVKQPLSYGVDKLHEKTGVDLNLSRVAKGMMERRKENQQERYRRGQQKAGEAMESGGRMHGILAMTGAPQTAWDQLTSMKGIRERLMGGKTMKKKREAAQAEIDKLKNLKGERAKIYTEQDKNLDVRKLNSGLTSLYLAITDFTDKIDSKKAQIARREADGSYEGEEGKALKKEDEKELNGLVKERADLYDTQDKTVAERDELEKKEINISEEDKVEAESLDQQIVEREKLQPEIEKQYQAKIDRNVPMYKFDIKAAEEQGINEETKRIQYADDPTELVRMLKDSINDGNKDRVKAIMLKLTKTYNDNEALQPLIGDTGQHGLKLLMRAFSGNLNEAELAKPENAELSQAFQKTGMSFDDVKKLAKAGFTREEAFGLGAQIAEMNKSTSHFGATAAYKMENGAWKETTDREHAEIRNVEMGKVQQQSQVRNFNRLAYGYHDKAGTFHIDANGLMLLQSLDNEGGHKNIKDTMNESAARNCYQSITDQSGNLRPEFAGQFSKKLVEALAVRLGNVKNIDFDIKYEKVKNYA